VFTASVGEHSDVVRFRSLSGLEPLDIEIDPVLNTEGIDPGGARVISVSDTRVAVCVVATDEERAIAREVASLLDLPGW